MKVRSVIVSLLLLIVCGFAWLNSQSTSVKQQSQTSAYEQSQPESELDSDSESNVDTQDTTAKNSSGINSWLSSLLPSKLKVPEPDDDLVHVIINDSVIHTTDKSYSEQEIEGRFKDLMLYFDIAITSSNPIGNEEGYNSISSVTDGLQYYYISNSSFLSHMSRSSYDKYVESVKVENGKIAERADITSIVEYVWSIRKQLWDYLEIHCPGWEFPREDSRVARVILLETYFAKRSVEESVFEPD